MPRKREVIVDTWEGCYPSKWRGLVVDDAMSHPAKFSNKLIRRIYEHMRAEGWIKPGDFVVDPFGGVALGALDAMRLGLRWRGNELEPRFVDLGRENIQRWKGDFGSLPNWGDAILYQGDSRFLSESVFRSEVTVSSPPYAEARIGQKSGQAQAGRGDQYGDTQGQLGGMEADDFAAAVTSPPFRQASGGAHAPKGMEDADPGFKARHAAGNGSSKAYGASEGQLANMDDGEFDAAMSSPPYADSVNQNDQANDSGARKARKAAAGVDVTRARNSGPPNSVLNQPQKYGDSSGNIGAASADNFWMAARAIVEQVYLILAPGGHAVWVCKDFVKDKQISPFCDQWRQLCEAVGFVTLHEHHANLVRATAIDFDGKHVRKESKSFFRRLAESKGSPRIDYEVVFCMVKPK